MDICCRHNEGNPLEQLEPLAELRNCAALAQDKARAISFGGKGRRQPFPVQILQLGANPEVLADLGPGIRAYRAAAIA